MNRARFALILCLALLGSAWGQDARAWWNNDWAFRKEISFDLSPTGADIAGAPADVPVLIRLSFANFPYFADAKPDGSDFVFISSDDKTPLKSHIERIDSQAQIAFVWVRMPHLTGGAKTDKIFLYYGNKKATSGADAPGSYDTAQALVYHFGAAAGSPQDSTGYKTDPTKFTAEQERRLRRTLEAFYRTASTRISAELRVPLELELLTSTQLTWANAHTQVPSNSLAALYGLAPAAVAWATVSTTLTSAPTMSRSRSLP